MSAIAWPPLIRAERVPRWVRVRDLVLTVAAWVLLAYWMRGALLLIGDWLSYPFLELSTYAAPDWQRIWLTLAPFVATAALLAAWLVFWAARRNSILRRQLSMTQPAALDVEAHAARFGLTTRQVSELREGQVLTVDGLV